MYRFCQLVTKSVKHSVLAFASLRLNNELKLPVGSWKINSVKEVIH